MLPAVALVGRPNVGKSTLFNRLTRSRDALVANVPGLTRDRQYGLGQLGPCPFIVVDTGGIGDHDAGGDGIAALMARQARQAIAEADHLLFVVDARDGCLPDDLDLASELRRVGKPLTLVVNKIDGLAPETAIADFHRLGLGQPWPVSASQGRGLQPLLETVCRALPAAMSRDAAAADARGLGEEGTRIAVVGRPNVGKSTLINRLLGEERVIAHDLPGTTRDSLFIPLQLGERRYTLIDTAGVRRRARIAETVEKFSVIKTLQALEASHVALLVVDARQEIGEQDANLAAFAIDSGRALVLAVNKWDGLSSTQRARVKQDIERKLGFLDFAERHTISALHGSGVGLLLDAADRAFANATRTLPTPLLTRLLEDAVREHPPPLVAGRRIKLRYAHQGGRNPPLIVIHGNRTEALPEVYRRYLNNRLQQRLELAGTPLRLEFKSGENPFAGRRNPLTPRQLRHRQRLLRHRQR